MNHESINKRRRGRPRKFTNSVVRVQFVMDENTLKEFDSKWQTEGFRERSEALRYLIINYLKGRV